MGPWYTWDAAYVLSLQLRPMGSHLAEVTLILTVARRYQLYDVIPDYRLTAEKMQEVDLGLLDPGCDEFFADASPHAGVQAS